MTRSKILMLRRTILFSQRPLRRCQGKSYCVFVGREISVLQNCRDRRVSPVHCQFQAQQKSSFWEKKNVQCWCVIKFCVKEDQMLLLLHVTTGLGKGGCTQPSWQSISCERWVLWMNIFRGLQQKELMACGFSCLTSPPIARIVFFDVQKRLIWPWVQTRSCSEHAV